MARVIFHVDINAFFASAEEMRKPALHGKPVAVGSNSRRGVVSTANYKAREYGVHSAQPMYEAKKLCPDLVIVPADFAYYRALSARFFAYLKKFTPYIEPASIDEGYMDVTETIRHYHRPLDLAYQIQNGLLETLGLHVSIGVAPTKFLAKMASDMRKPMGITVLRRSELKQKLWPLPIESIHGLGKKSAALLRKEGIETIGDFADPDNEQLIIGKLKKNGYQLIRKVRGRSTDRLDVSTTRKSISASRTYDYDLTTLEETGRKVQELCREVVNKMHQEHQMGKMVSLSLRDTEFHTIVRSTTFSNYVDAYPVLYQALMNLLEENFEPIGYRYVGVHIGSLKYAEKVIIQPSLFEKPVEDTSDIVTQLNKRIDGIHLMKASDLLKGEGHE
ncbi:MAG: DNA polymerase IV [Catenisphaera adipataccumulans]|jgi:DNA polymerase-4|uniref:DNA polymerase IV n=1 Tax=Catenisphaera adipataccumulans TaxID=700500 RepID=UPI003D8B19D4